MKKLNIFFSVVIALALAVIYFIFMRSSRNLEAAKCDLKPVYLRGIITDKAGYSHFSTITVNGSTFRVKVDSLKYRKGYGYYHYCEVGDSIIKEADSKIINIRRADSVCIFTIDCND